MYNNDKKIIALVYLIMTMAGIGVILPFVVQGPAVRYFNSTPEAVAYAFSFCMTGTIITTFLNGYIVKFLPIKYLIIIISIIYFCFCVFIFFTTSLYLTTIALFILGLDIGVMDTIPSFIIIHSFDESSRTSRLNHLDFFFSLGSLIYPTIVTLLLFINSNYIYQYSYALVAILFCILIYFSLKIKFPDLNKVNKSFSNDSIKIKFSKWNFGVISASIAMFFYFVSYVGFTYWCVAYLQHTISISEQLANESITLFWILYAVGCLISSVAVKKIAVQYYITGSAIVGIIAYLLIMTATNTTTAFIYISLLGLASSSLYSSLVSYGSSQVKYPSPRLIAFLILASAIATNVGESLSTYLVAFMGLNGLVWISAFFMLLVVIFMIITMAYQKRQVVLTNN